MSDMGRWDADEPGTTAAWWSAKQQYIPKYALLEFGEFLQALGNYESNPDAAILDTVLEAAQGLRYKLSFKRRTTFKLHNRDTRILGIIPGRIVVLTDPSARPNVVLALKNYEEAMAPNVVPKQYQV